MNQEKEEQILIETITKISKTKVEDYIKMINSYLEDYKKSNDVQNLSYARGWLDALEKNHTII